MTHNLNSVAKLDYTGMHPKLFWIKWLHKGYQFFPYSVMRFWNYKLFGYYPSNHKEYFLYLRRVILE
ncbi:hypothetical protein CMT74_08235 [Elizabethkingia anophelis]|nr:hypothetical protein [Elizabethkingia anophelis]